MEKWTLRLNLTYGHLGRQPLKPLGSEVTHPPWPPSVHITNHHYHLHITLLTQPPVHYTTNTTTYYIHHTHTTTFTYNNNPLHTITWSCRHTCRPHALSCRSHAGSCRSHAGCHAVTCTLYPYLVDFAEHHSLDTGSELFFLTLHPLFVDRLCIHMT